MGYFEGDTLATVQYLMYSHYMLNSDELIDVTNRLGRAMADSSRSRILLSLLEAPSYPAQLADELDLSRTNVSNHLACLRGCGLVTTESCGRRTLYRLADPHLAAALSHLIQATIAVDQAKTCTDPACTVVGCCNQEAKN